jgi:hypothetical protein
MHYLHYTQSTLRKICNTHHHQMISTIRSMSLSPPCCFLSRQTLTEHTTVPLTGCPCSSLQVFCVWLTPNQDLAYVLATGYVASSILLSGFYMRIADMRLYTLRFLSYLSYTKYAMEGVSKMELSGIIYPGCSGSRLPHGFSAAAQVGLQLHNEVLHVSQYSLF